METHHNDHIQNCRQRRDSVVLLNWNNNSLYHTRNDSWTWQADTRHRLLNWKTKIKKITLAKSLKCSDAGMSLFFQIFKDIGWMIFRISKVTVFTKYCIFSVKDIQFQKVKILNKAKCMLNIYKYVCYIAIANSHGQNIFFTRCQSFVDTLYVTIFHNWILIYWKRLLLIPIHWFP